MTLDGIPAGLPVNISELQLFLNRRAPGLADWSTTRKEADVPEFIGGIVDGYTCGAPIAAIIRNTNTHPSDYSAIQDTPRPGHADYTAFIKYGGFQDAAGGGHFSGRLTAPLCIAGGMCLQWLREMGIEIRCHILKIGNIQDRPFDPCDLKAQDIPSSFPVLDEDAGIKMQAMIREVSAAGNSIGGIAECIITGLPAGIGEPIFGGIENHLAQILFGIPAVKGIEFGDETDLGSAYNDAFYSSKNRILTRTNHCGGILGGISNGMGILFRVRVKPTPSIAQTQETVSLTSGTCVSVNVPGRHDPCIVPRAIAVIEAASAIAIYDLILGNTQTSRRKHYGFENTSGRN